MASNNTTNQNQVPEINLDILVVDDTPDNLRLLANILTEEGYHVRPVSSGAKALRTAHIKPPALILLDIMMPEMDGYEVCRQLKADDKTCDIPVMFISALSDTSGIVKALDMGGVDYITKPFEPQEVLARVETHLNLRRMQQQLQQQNERLQQEIAERQRAEHALREANATKDTFFSIIAHDLRSPFTALFGYTELALLHLDSASLEKIRHYISEIKTSAESVYALLENLLTWSRIQRGVITYHPRSIALYSLCDEVITLLSANAAHKQIMLRCRISPGIRVYADVDMLNTIIRNLVINAIKFTYPGGFIDLSAQPQGPSIEISVTDTGRGIPEEARSQLFRVDVKTTTAGTEGEGGTGLGLPLCKDLIEKNGGAIRIKSIVGQGTTVSLTLPCSQDFFETTYKSSQDLPAAETAAGAQEASSSSESLIIPAQEEFEKLYSATMEGDVLNIQQQLRELEAGDPRYLPFIRKISRLVDLFMIDEIQVFMEQYLAR